MLLILAVGLCVAVSICGESFAISLFNFWVKTIVESGLGDAQMHVSGAKPDSALSSDQCISYESILRGPLLNDSGEEIYFSPRLKMAGLVSLGSKSVYFSGLAIVPESEKLVSPRIFLFSGGEGRFIENESDKGIVLGKDLAETLQANVGDTVNVSVTTLSGTLNVASLVVQGIINFPDRQVSKRIVYLHLHLAQKIYGAPNCATELALKFNEQINAEEWVKSHKNGFLTKWNLSLKAWSGIWPEIKKIGIIGRRFVESISALLFLSVSLSLLQLINLSISERKREIGLLAALGASPSEIWRVFAAEGFLIGIFGAVVGWICAFAIILIVGLVGIPIPNPFFTGYVTVFLSFPWCLSLVILSIAVIISCLSGFFPAMRAARMNPITVLKSQS